MEQTLAEKWWYNLPILEQYKLSVKYPKMNIQSIYEAEHPKLSVIKNYKGLKFFATKDPNNVIEIFGQDNISIFYNTYSYPIRTMISDAEKYFTNGTWVIVSEVPITSIEEVNNCIENMYKDSEVLHEHKYIDENGGLLPKESFEQKWIKRSKILQENRAEELNRDDNFNTSSIDAEIVTISAMLTDYRKSIAVTTEPTYTEGFAVGLLEYVRKFATITDQDFYVNCQLKCTEDILFDYIKLIIKNNES